jgi:hypothetical protein
MDLLLVETVRDDNERQCPTNDSRARFAWFRALRRAAAPDGTHVHVVGTGVRQLRESPGWGDQPVEES